ncbi:CCR4-NOT transcription complex subunit [Achlya hypogyna]|uniref:CCR4-NOT transcription complex subunit n=1 Tax=Achlya hypogyna TaxID=1202772 RepID=A0A1V9Z016_ACHHY|nr:CCR4-NOT transcription complex subunit [Achlya hypogyna]
MVAFASPLFWQIHYLITSLSKKNFKTHVAELNQLVGLYGEDARVYLLSCLVREIDFRDTKSHKDSLKVQLLTHELGQASTKPNFTTFLVHAIQGDGHSPSVVNEEFLVHFCKVVKISLPQQITIGLAFTHAESRAVAMEAIAFLKTKLPELAMAGAKLPADVLHGLVYLLRTDEAFQLDLAQTDSFLASIAAVHHSEMSTLELKPLTLGNLDLVDSLDVAGIADTLVDDVLGACTFYDLMEDVGYQCTATPKAFRGLLAEAGLENSPSIPPGHVAGMLSMLTRTFKGQPTDGAVLVSTLPSFEDSDATVEPPALDTWNIDVIAEVFAKDYPSIKWPKVQEKLDRDDLDVADPVRFRVLLSCFQLISRTKFRVLPLLKPWKHHTVHLQLLTAAIAAPPEVVSFADSPNKLNPFEGADAAGAPKNGAWFSLDVVETLLGLGQGDAYGSVLTLLSAAKAACPDVLIANLAHASSRWNGLREELFCDLFYLYVAGRPNAALIVRYLYTVDPKLVLLACVKCWLGAPNVLPRLFALLRNTGDAFATALASNYYSFALSLAVLAANHDVLTLDTWLQERLTGNVPFATAVVAFVHRQYARAVPKVQLTPATSALLTVESLATVLKVLLALPLPPALAMEVKNVVALCAKTHSILKNEAAPEPASVTVEMIEEQANAYFQQIYTSEQNINDVVAMLKRFQASKDETERQIFVCMVHNLFDEYRFFPRYPETELRITGVLFGKLIEHQVLPSTFLQTALRLVLDSLREPTTSKFFFFGACALQQFVPRLRELPAYCANLSQIAHLQHALPEIMRQVNAVTRTLGASDADDAPPAPTPTPTPTPTPAPLSVVVPPAAPVAVSPSSPKIALPPTAAAAPATMSIDHIFGAESLPDDRPAVEPEQGVVDRLHFIVNNMSISTLEAKLPEVRHLLAPDFYPWFAQYLVAKRVATQPNYHAVYLIFMEKVKAPALETAIFKTCLQQVRALLTSGTITTNSQQRTLLKNLGSWMGLMTLGRNKPLLQRDLDLKELLYVGYETGHLIAVTPLVAKVLEGCKKSKIFKPPNPWIMGLIHAMSELYDVPDLKLNLKFEIEVLFKSFKLNVEDQLKANLLHTRGVPPRTCNPDFNIKVAKPATTPTGRTSPLTPKIAKPATPTPVMAKPALKPKETYPPANSGSATVSESTVIPNLASYVAVNPDLPLHHVNLRRLVPLAVDRAIREVITPVVERSVTIACITTREVILKDFATEADEAKMRKAAHVMVSSLAGSLALITAKDPLRNSIASHLRALLPTSDPHQVDHVVTVCSTENTDLGCMLIEKASSEKAMRDIDEALGAAYASRRRFVPKGDGAPVVFEGSLPPPPSLPPVFQPSVHGISPHQWMVYDAFARIPRPTALTPPARPEADGLSVQQALERFAVSMEKFEVFVQHVVRTAAAAQRELPGLLALPPESDVFGILRDIRALGAAVKASVREEACLKIANRIVKCMYELGKGRGDELFLDILVSCLDMLSASCDGLKKEVVRWILSMAVDDKLKLHCEIIIALVRLKVVEVSEFDAYLTRNMERTGLAIEFAVYVVRQCLFLDHVHLGKQLPQTLDALERIVERHGAHAATNKNIVILSNLLEQAKKPKGVGAGPGSPPKPAKPAAPVDPAAFRHTVSNAMEHWVALVNDPANNHSKMHVQFVAMLKQHGLLKDDEAMSAFFKGAIDICVDVCLKSSYQNKPPGKVPLQYTVVDACTQLLVFLIKYLDAQASAKLQVLTLAVGAVVSSVIAAHDAAVKTKALFDQRVYLRILANLLKELTMQEPMLDAIHLQVLNTFAGALNQLQPMSVPGFCFAWTELVSHRCFMPMLLRAKQQRGWQILHRLLMSLLVFMEPFLRTMPPPASVGALYKGTVRVVLVLLHDYPDFLAEFYTSFCDVLPAACIQLRNVILSAFSRSMRLPDPLTPGLQVAALPEVNVAPRLMPTWSAALAHNQLKEYLEAFLTATSNRAALFPHELIDKLLRSPASAAEAESKYMVPALNAVVLYLGKEAIAEMTDKAVKFEQSAMMDVFRFLAEELDMEGRYWYFSAMANHLRFPNSHTHYFSCVLLYLFSHSKSTSVKEQITRVLLERLIANRPHPWGLLVTFIELIRNPSYKFWDQDYLNCSSEIRDVFDDVARTCMGSVPFPRRTPKDE